MTGIDRLSGLCGPCTHFTVHAYWSTQAAAVGIANPVLPVACPDIFMKGENISPNRQGSKRLHRRKSVIGFSAARNTLDIAAAEAEATMDSDDDDDDLDDLDALEPAIIVPPPPSPDNPKSFVRRKSVLPQDIQVVMALENYQTHELRTESNKQLRRVNSGREGFAHTEERTASTHDMDISDDAAQGYLDVTSGDLDADGDDDGEQALTGFSAGVSDGSSGSPSNESNTNAGAGMMGWTTNIDDSPSTTGCWFTKRKAGAFGRSRKRWFLLDELNRKIAYYVDDISGKVIGPNDVRGMIEVNAIASVVVKGKVLVIKTGSRTFQLTAATGLVSQEWKRKLDEMAAEGSINRAGRQDSVYGFGSGDELNKVGDDAEPVNDAGEIIQGARGSNSLGGMYGAGQTISPQVSASLLQFQQDQQPEPEPTSPKPKKSGGKKKKGATPTRAGNAGPVMESWNVGTVNKANCEAAVVAANNGDFLLRSLKNGKMILCVNDAGNAVNFTIKRNDVSHRPFRFASHCLQPLSLFLLIVSRFLYTVQTNLHTKRR